MVLFQNQAAAWQLQETEPSSPAAGIADGSEPTSLGCFGSGGLLMAHGTRVTVLHQDTKLQVPLLS